MSDAVRARYEGQIEAFEAVIEKARTWNGNGHDEPSDPCLDAVIGYVTDLRRAVVRSISDLDLLIATSRQSAGKE